MISGCGEKSTLILVFFVLVGQYAVTPGHNEPCLFYVDFEDNIYVYYNLYIQTQPLAQFQDIVKADTNLVGPDVDECMVYWMFKFTHYIVCSYC